MSITRQGAPERPQAEGPAQSRGAGSGADLEAEALATLLCVLRQVNASWARLQGPRASASATDLALVFLNHSGQRQLSQRELGLGIGRSPAAITRIVDELEAAGLVERQPHRFDRRLNMVAITAAGRDAAIAHEATLQKLALAAFRDESAERLSALSEVLRRVTRRLQP